MAKLTRRVLLKRTSLSAATIGALMAAPGLGAAAALAEGDSAAEASRGHLVAYVHDTSKGELALLVGTREIIVRDRELVKRLARAANAAR